MPYSYRKSKIINPVTGLSNDRECHKKWTTKYNRFNN